MFLGHGNRFAGGHLHTIGNRCWCGYLAVPTRFHDRDGKGNVVGGGEKQYLAWLASDEKPDYVNPPVMAEIKRDIVPESPIKRTDVPESPIKRTDVPESPIKRTDVPEITVCPSRPKGTDSPQQGRPKKWESEAKRKAAYRERRR